MKRVLFLLIMLLCVVLLTGCNAVPEEVQDDIDRYNYRPAEERADSNLPQYDTLENIIAHTPAEMTRKIGNVFFDGIIRVPQTDTLSELTLGYNPVFNMHRRDIFRFFLPYEDEPDENFIFDQGYQDWGGEYYMDENIGISISEDGFLVTMPSTAEKSEENPGGYLDFQFYPVEEIIQCYRGEPLTDTPYPFRGGELSLTQASRQVLDFLNTDPWRQWESGYEYMIRTAFIRKMGNDTYGFEFCVERLYNGVSIDATKFYEFYDDPEDLKRKGDVRRRGTPIYIFITDPYGPSGWTFRAMNSYVIIKDEPLPGPFITFDAALEAACGAISQKANITIRSAELCYDAGYRGFRGIYNERSIKDYFSMPVWAFIIDRRSISQLKNGHDTHWTLFVNALNGEVYVYDNPPGY